MNLSAMRDDTGLGALPTPLTTLVGRQRETDQIRSLMAAHRLLVLTGSGGCGKTRLAVHVARSSADAFPDGAVWVDLSGALPSADVGALLAEAVGISDRFGGSQLDAVITRLRTSRSLVVLDNCEHVASAAADVVTRLLTVCEHLTILATSRTPIGVDGEVLFRVPSLEVGGDELSQAASLFVDRAGRARHDFTLGADDGPTVAAICRRLDGIPLAIELAAARVRMHDLDEIASSLEGRFELLAAPRAGVVPRQQTIEASVGWSYELLDERERTTLARLSVFHGAFTLDGAQAVATDEDLAAPDVLASISVLVDHSLVEVDIDPAGSRYRLLETIRSFAATRLNEDPGEQSVAIDKHVAHYRGIARRATRLTDDGDAMDALELFADDESNLFAALERADDFEDIVAIASNQYWQLRGRFAEALVILRRVIDADDSCPPGLRIDAALASAQLALAQWDLAECERMSAVALELARDAGDVRGEAAGSALLGAAMLWTGRRAEAQPILEEARRLADATGDGPVLALATLNLAQLPFALGDVRRARVMFETAADLARRYGQLRTLFEADAYLFLVHWFAGRDQLAAVVCDEALAIARRWGLTFGESMLLSFAASLEIRRGDLSTAEELIERAGVLAEVSGHPLAHGHLLSQRAFLACAHGRLEEALAHFETCGQLGLQMSITLAGLLHTSKAAEVASTLGQWERADNNLETALRWEEDIGQRFPHVAVVAAAMSLLRDDLVAAEEHAHDAIALARELDSDITNLEGIEALAIVWARSGRSDDAARLFGASDAIRTSQSWTAATPLSELVTDGRRIIGEASLPALEQGRTLSLQDATSYAQRGRGARRRPAFGWESLTPAELRVAELVAEGLSNADIASKLFVTVPTVKTHLTHIYAKTGTASRVQLATAYAERTG